MSKRATIEQICAMLNARSRDVVARVLPANARRPERGGKIWALNPKRTDPSWDSFVIYTDRGIYKDFSATAADGGDMFKFVAVFLYGGDNKKAYRWALDFLGLDNATPPDPAELKKLEEQRAEQEKREAAKLEARRKWCLAQFLSAKPLIPGDPPSEYLRLRGIDVHALPEGVPGCLRYAPALDLATSTYWDNDKKRRIRRDGPFPALVAMVSLEGTPGGCATIHGTGLHATNEGWKKVTRGFREDGKQLKPKEVFCAYSGGTIRLTKGKSGKPLSHAPKGEWILVSEGIENGLTAAKARPDLRVIASVAVANMAAMKLPPQLGGVTILADNDASDSEATAALNRAMDAIAKQGFDVAVARVDGRFKDFNEALMGV